MSIRESLDRINTQILSGDLIAAESGLRKIKPFTPTEKRMTAHFYAIIEFRRGHFAQALDIMREARDSFGANVNLVRDMVACFYQMGDMVSFRTALDELERSTTDLENVLHSKSLFECELMIGKFFEEDARLAPALIYYEKALLRANLTPHRIRALLQKGRWLALYEPDQTLSTLYRELISVDPQSMSKDLRIEFEHSLMLIELRLIGADHAWQRCLRLDSDTDEIDQRLLVFDFIEGCLMQDLGLKGDVLNTMNKFCDLDPYEEFIKSLIQSNLTPNEKIKKLTGLAAQLPWASYLRLLCLTANLESDMTAKQELNRKIQLIIASLDHKSQGLWMGRIQRALKTPEVRVEFSVRRRAIVVHGKTIDLSKKKIGQQLLGILLTKSALTVDQAIQHLWQTTFTPEHYHRLRMGIHRLNTLIHDVSGYGKIIEVDAQEVRLRPEVQLRAVDDPDIRNTLLN